MSGTKGGDGKLNRAAKYRLDPDSGQRASLDRQAESILRTWNLAARLCRQYRHNGEYLPDYDELAPLLTEWRRACPLMACGVAQAQQQCLKEFSGSIRAYLASKNPQKNPPHYKPLKGEPSIRYPRDFGLSESARSIRLPKIGLVGCRPARPLPEGAKPRQCVVRREDGHWFAHIHYEIDPPPSLSGPPREGEVVGLDLGVVRLATLSDGTCFPGREDLEYRLQRQLALEEVKLGKKEKGSKNWWKQWKRREKVKRKIRNKRLDDLHKASTAITQSYPYVVVENISVQRLIHLGRAEGRRNQGVSAQGWGEFLHMLAYKLEDRGGRLIRVPAKNTSRTCPRCDFISASNRTLRATFRCCACGFTDHADLVAAINIRSRGLGELAAA